MTVPANLILLRGLIPELPMRPGDLLPARVFSRDTIVLAGVRVAAQVPDNLVTGQRLRLRVEEASQSKLLLRVVETSGTEQQVLPPSVTADPLGDAMRAGLAVPLPGGQVARLFVDPDDAASGGGGRGGGGLQRVTLRFEAAALGRVDLALEILPTAVAGTIHVAAGAAAERLGEHADELRAALAQATGRPASVSVRRRDESVDLRA